MYTPTCCAPTPRMISCNCATLKLVSSAALRFSPAEPKRTRPNPYRFHVCLHASYTARDTSLMNWLPLLSGLQGGASKPFVITQSAHSARGVWISPPSQRTPFSPPVLL